MRLHKGLWAAMALCVVAGMASADPMRTVFTKENKFPGALGWELSLGGGGSSYDGDWNEEDVNRWDVTPGVRFGLTDRVALRGEVPYVGYSAGDLDETGLGDVSLGVDFLFFEDIFEYAWIIPHATAFLPTGDEDKGLGQGDPQGRFGISIGTTVNDVVHFALDGSYTTDGSLAEDDEGLLAGALSIVWDLDERASVLGEVQMRDDPVDPDEDFALQGHVGLAYKINKHFTLMGYVGGASEMAEDFYGMGRLVYAF